MHLMVALMMAGAVLSIVAAAVVIVDMAVVIVVIVAIAVVMVVAVVVMARLVVMIVAAVLVRPPGSGGCLLRFVQAEACRCPSARFPVDSGELGAFRYGGHHLREESLAER